MVILLFIIGFKQLKFKQLAFKKPKAITQSKAKPK
jgi:hypothetical protein